MTEATMSGFAIARRCFAAAVLAGGLFTGPAWAHDAAGHDEGAEAKAAGGAEARVTLRDNEVRDRQGRPMRFKSEAVGDRIVAIGFVYTTCTTACPIVSAILSQVQDMLGPRLGRDAWLMTLSIDPARDTPARMAKVARNFGAGENWLWLTGEKAEVDPILIGLGAYVADIESHPPMFLVGDGARGEWSRLYGFPPPEEIVARLEDLIAKREGERTSWLRGD